MSRADYWICPVCDSKALYDDSTEDAPDYCRPVTVVHDECLELLTVRAAADERAKVAEDIAKAIEADDGGEYGCCGCPKDRDYHAGIARNHAIRMPGAAQEATEPPDAYPSEGSAVPSPQKPAREGQR